MYEESQLNNLSVDKKNAVPVWGFISTSCSRACVYIACAYKLTASTPSVFVYHDSGKIWSLFFFLADSCHYLKPHH